MTYSFISLFVLLAIDGKLQISGRFKRIPQMLMQEVGGRAPNSLRETALSHRFAYVNDSWVKTKTQEVQAFTEHINSMSWVVLYTMKRTEVSKE